MELTIQVDEDRTSNDYFQRAREKFRAVVLPSVVKLAGAASNTPCYAIKYKEERKILEGIIKLDDKNARKIVKEQLLLNKQGIVVKWTEREGTFDYSKEYEVVSLDQKITLKDAVDKTERIIGGAGLIRRYAGQLCVRVSARHLADARKQLLPEDQLGEGPSLSVVGRQTYILKGLPDADPLVVANKLGQWNWPVVIVGGPRGSARRGSLRVAADTTPPAEVIHLSTGPVTIHKEETEYVNVRKQRVPGAHPQRHLRKGELSQTTSVGGAPTRQPEATEDQTEGNQNSMSDDEDKCASAEGTAATTMAVETERRFTRLEKELADLGRQQQEAKDQRETESKNTEKLFDDVGTAMSNGHAQTTAALTALLGRVEANEGKMGSALDHIRTKLDQQEKKRAADDQTEARAERQRTG